MNKNIDKIVMGGLFIAIGAILPQLFHIAQLGTVVSPMHFPVILGGLILGLKYGFAVGVLTPLVTALIFGKPPLFPAGFAMALELGVYGFIAGLINTNFKFSKNIYINLYAILISAMLLGRIVAILTNSVFYLVGSSDDNFMEFLATLFVTGLPGIVLQVLMIPPLYLRIKSIKP
ncbi:MAG: ECF transporter S component [Bacilli bacterium]